MSRRVLLHMTVALAAAALLALPGLIPRQAGWADVGEVPLPGGLVTPGDKTDEIRMESESVLFSIRPDDGTFAEWEAEYYAHVTADFMMRNLTQHTVPMELFFPFHTHMEAEYYEKPDYARLLQTKNVKVRVDGQEVAIRYDDLTFSPERGTAAAGVFSVDFPAGRETTIQIEYDLRAVPVPKGPSFGFEYIMQTGSHWAGTIGNGKVILEFWQPVDSKSALGYVNDFFQARNGRLEWDFVDLEPTPDHDITVTFEPTALETWARRPSYVKDIQAGTPVARTVPVSSPAYLLDTARAGRGWVVEQPRDLGLAWLRFDLDRAHTVAGLLIRAGIPEGIWNESREADDTFRRPKTVAIALSDGLTHTVSLEDMPGDWQMVSLPSTPTSSIRLSFLDSYPGTGRADAFLGVGRIQLIGVDAGSAGESGDCTGPNLLRNGGFEEGLSGQGTALGWSPFSSGEGASYGFSVDRWSQAVYEGTLSQLVAIATYAGPVAADRSAGVSQAVTGLRVGAEYELSLAGLMREEAAHPGEDPYRYRVQWALARGGTDWTEVTDWQDVPWDTLYLRTEPGEFSTHTARLFAPGDRATLFIRAWKKWATAGRELDVNLDAIALRKCGSTPVRGLGWDSWNLAHDLRVSPDQENPNRDSYGNKAVWHFLEGANDRRDPSAYTLLSSFTSHAFGIQGLEQWTGTREGSDQDLIPAIGINRTDQTQSYGTVAWPPHSVRVHPAAAPAVVGWQSPISGQVRISGMLSDMDANCGNGVRWAIDLEATALISGTLVNGEAQDFADALGGTQLQSVSVSKGDFVYFVVDPNGEAGCDSTELAIRIESTAYRTGALPTEAAMASFVWKSQSPPVSPSPRCCMGFVYDAARGVLVAVGGGNWTQVSNETWEYDGHAWTRVVVSAGPSARWDPGLAYDPLNQRTVLFGGMDWDGEFGWLDDTWHYAVP